VLLGYQIALIANVRAQVQHPLPRWDDISEYFSTGAQAMIGAIVYALPLIIAGCCIASASSFFGNEDTLSGITVAVTCCLVPIMLAYLVALIPLYSLALGRFVDDPRAGVFFEFSAMLQILRSRLDVVGRFLLLSLVFSIGISILNGVPCLGTVASLAVTTPINGILIGMFTGELLGKPKRKPNYA
jgi:Protein of unknown function (DUF4013)